MSRAQGMMIAPMLALILVVILSTETTRADVNVTVVTTDDIDIDMTTLGDGALLSIDYNGRDLLQEIEDYLKTISDLRSVIVSLAMRNDLADLNDQMVDLEYDLDKLVDELNLVFNDLYSKVTSYAHIIGINPSNATVAVNLISGNMTLVDYIEGILVDIDAIQVEIDTARIEIGDLVTSTGLEFIVLYDQISLVESDSAATELRLQKLISEFDEELEVMRTRDVELKDDIDLQNMTLQELREEISSIQDEIIKERKARENITVMFGLFSVIVIVMNVRTRK